ncbi:MAG: AAA family ATPase, partial [Candidatus Krumholzibacteriia bacterium]
RKEPFMVVLLDEFEKAHPNVWDVFLQVFDAGRLTDRRGNTADFRNAIIIMTSNLGGVIPSGTSLGFTTEGAGFRPEPVERAIAQAFRKEFLNRIDRVVVFRPLSRETMREILHNELNEITRRRGLRSRTWAIEWEDDAIEFLLAKGFTDDLGARPVKRAIERYVLSPLAETIVNHQFPEGDQFLFVRAEGSKLAVEFVDPDAPAPAEAVAAAEDVEAGGILHLEGMTLDGRGTPSEIAALRHHYERIHGCVEGEGWQRKKQAALGMTAAPEFWRSRERFAILGEAEYMDRIENGVLSAGSLLERLVGSGSGKREHYPRDLVRRLAHQLYLLDAAYAGVVQRQPRDAFLLVEAGSGGGVSSSVHNEFAERLGRMYRGWASKRRMQLRVLEESGVKTPYRLLLAVSGYAAFRILHPEDGVHVYEVPEPRGGSFKRCNARVRVVPQPDEPAARPQSLREQAARALRQPAADKLAIVRRYRELPSPLVRDGARGWRTGKLERVLQGDFDLILEAGRDR